MNPYEPYREVIHDYVEEQIQVLLALNLMIEQDCEVQDGDNSSPPSDN